MQGPVGTLLIAAAVVILWAVGVEAAGPRVLSGHAVTSWTTSDGAAIGPVMAFAQDADGYLWLGTTTGVVRFDGARFIAWDAIGDTALPRVSVFALTFARDGTLWIGFDGIGVRGIRRGAVIAPEAGTPPRGRITSLLEDRDGTLWAVSAARLYRLRNQRWEEIDRQTLAADDVYSVAELPPGELWIGAGSGAFRLNTSGEFERVDAAPARGVAKAGDGTVWVSDPVRVIRRLDNGRTPAGAAGRGLRLLHDSRGNIWVATIGQGLWRVRSGATDASLVEQATAQTGLSANVVQAIFEDREGNIWVGTMAGVHSLTPQFLEPLGVDGLVRAVEPGADGSVWVGTTQGLMRFTASDGEWHGATAGVDGLEVRALHRDAAGTLWIGTERDLRRLHGRDAVPVPTAQPLRGVRSITSIGPNTWVGDGQQLLRVDRDVATANGAHAARHPGIVKAYADSRGNLWTATRDGSMVVTTREGKHIAFPAPEDAGLEGVRATDAIFEDTDHVVWVGGTAGLRRFSEGQVATLDRRNGLPAARVMAITQDQAGYLWLLADRGPAYVGRRGAVIRLRPDDFEKAAAGKQPLDYSLYDSTHGVALLTIQNTAATRSTDGSLWFVAGGSLTVIDPRRLPHAASPRPPARIEDAIIDGTRVAASPNVPLPAGTRNVQIDYTSLRLTSPGQLRFRYKLEGFDRDWVSAGARRQAYYTLLEAGDYAFHVSASGDGATWGPTAVWRFSVRPAFHETGWFFGLMAACFGLVGWGTWRGRGWVVEQRFSAVLTERARLAREIHDTMLQSLVGLALQCQAIARRCSPDSEQREQLLDLRRQVEDQIRAAREAILDIRSPILETQGLVPALDSAGRRALASSGAAFEIVSDVRTDRLPTAVQSELLRIGQEAIANAAKHSAAAMVRVEVRSERGATVLRVSDDGRGFDYDGVLVDLNGHYGLISMRERAARLGGRLTVNSVQGRGTTVELMIPANATPRG